MEADNHYNVQALLEEVGVQQISADWGCACGDDTDAAARCQCECASAKDPASDGWETVNGEDGREVSCSLGVGGEPLSADCAFVSLVASSADSPFCLRALRDLRRAVRMASGSMRHLGTHGVVARRSESRLIVVFGFDQFGLSC